MRYFAHALHRKSRFRLHSPFIYHFYSEVLKGKDDFPEFHAIGKIRGELTGKARFIKRKDLGTGGKDSQFDQRFAKVNKVARRSSVSPAKGAFLFRLIRDTKPDTILELGTAFGISTLYLAMPALSSKVVSIEGCLDSVHIAEDNFQKIPLKNVVELCGDFDEKLPEAIQRLGYLDFVFFDGNHQKEATLRYFNHCLQHIRNNSVFVFDDIHWSGGMQEAWREICRHPRVKISIDLFTTGVVFFREELSKEHYVLSF